MPPRVGSFSRQVQNAKRLDTHAVGNGALRHGRGANGERVCDGRRLGEAGPFSSHPSSEAAHRADEFGLLLENAGIGVAQAIRGIFGGGCIDGVVVRSWSLSNRRSIRIGASRSAAERVAWVRTGGARSAAYGMPGRQGFPRITCGPSGRSSSRRRAATARSTRGLCRGERAATNE